MESKLTRRFYTRTGSMQAGKRILPWRMVKATLEKPVTSWAESAERTTIRRPCLSLAMRPERAAYPTRSAGLVVSVAKISCQVRLTSACRGRGGGRILRGKQEEVHAQVLSEPKRID